MSDQPFTMTPETLLQHHDHAQLWPSGCGLDLPAAYRAALAVRTMRMARGEQPRGYKVGFTNRTIWDRYKVFAPIWGAVWNSTLSFCEGEDRVNLAGTCQPRIEPEVVFALSCSRRRPSDQWRRKSRESRDSCRFWLGGPWLVKIGAPGQIHVGGNTLQSPVLGGGVAVTGQHP